MTNPTGDALAAHDKVVEAVARAIAAIDGKNMSSFERYRYRVRARIAISVYEDAMRDGTHEKVVEAVARAIVKARAMDPDKLDDHARAAIEAYEKAMQGK